MEFLPAAVAYLVVRQAKEHKRLTKRMAYPRADSTFKTGRKSPVPLLVEPLHLKPGVFAHLSAHGTT